MFRGARALRRLRGVVAGIGRELSSAGPGIFHVIVGIAIRTKQIHLARPNLYIDSGVCHGI